jgi:lipid-A-disaccharide synthase-like uncharacterized protein
VTLPPVLAFQPLWDGLGWLGQALFAWRMIHQWWESEKARRSVLPAAFWWWSLAATLPLLVYQLHRGDGVFLAGALVSGALYVRNLVLLRRGVLAETRRRSPAGSILLGLLVLGVLTLLSWKAGSDFVRWDQPVVWLVVGFVGQTIWSGRFVLQWWVSERRGESVLPASFFALSIAGALLLCAYAIHRHDWVMIAAYALNPIPYARNLVLIRRDRKERSAARPGGCVPPDPAPRGAP